MLGFHLFCNIHTRTIRIHTGAPHTSHRIHTHTHTHEVTHTHTQTHEAKHLHLHIANGVVFIIHTRTRRRQRWKGTHVELLPTHTHVRCSVLQCIAVCCSALQCVAVRCSVLQYCCTSREFADTHTCVTTRIRVPRAGGTYQEQNCKCFRLLSAMLRHSWVPLFLSASRCILCSTLIHILFFFPLSLSLSLFYCLSLSPSSCLPRAAFSVPL